MPSNRDDLSFILDQLSALPDVSSRAMMGEYILYVQGKVVGGIYDGRLLLKPTAATDRLLPDAPRELPYEGAKPMVLVEEADNRDFLCSLFGATAAELPAPKKKKRA
ncbi:MAG: TfoX/Sxy family protein [Clostridia bacterium]|nr:TfoX/Sxy family protein [Clostridia bacterium]